MFNRGYGSVGKGAHERIVLDDIIQVLLVPGFRRKHVLSGFISNVGTPHFFIIGCLVQSNTSHAWAVVKECTLKSPSTVGQLPEQTQLPLLHVYTEPFYDTQVQSDIYFLKLDKSMRKVGMMHDCQHTGKCRFNFDNRTIQHSTTTLDGGCFYLMTRSMSYPPRRS